MSHALATANAPSAPRIGVRAITGFLEFLEQKGCNADAFLQARGMSRDLFADPEGDLLLATFVDLFELASDESGDDCFGAHFALCYPLQYTGLAGHVTRHCPTVGAGCQAIARYYSLLADSSRIDSSLAGEQVKLSYRVTDTSIWPRRQDAECMIAVLLGWLRETLGAEFCPDEVWFEHARPSGAAELSRSFGAPLRFEQTDNALLFPRRHLQTKLRSADDELHQLLTARVEELMRQKSFAPDLVKAVRDAVRGTLEQDDGSPTLQSISSRLQLGPRTLQRRLRDAGQSFQQVLESCRHDLALRYLSDRRLSVTEVAMRLRYADVTAFNRAFRRWTGSVPSFYRR